MEDEDYTPAERPPGHEKIDRVRFEREGAYEQGIFGGSAKDIEDGIWANQDLSAMLLGNTITFVGSERGDWGKGSLHELKLGLSNGTTVRIHGVGITVEIVS